MTDSDKVKLIAHVVVDAREYGDNGCAEYLSGILDAVISICDFEEKQDVQ